MKNKKLFAILTLVCFMFTLMPVAAFAAADDLDNTRSVLYLAADQKNVLVETTTAGVFETTNFEIALRQVDGDKGTVNVPANASALYIWATEGAAVSPAFEVKGIENGAIAAPSCNASYPSAIANVYKFDNVADGAQFEMSFVRGGEFTIHVGFGDAAEDTLADVKEFTTAAGTITVVDSSANPEGYEMTVTGPDKYDIDNEPTGDKAGFDAYISSVVPNNVSDKFTLHFDTKAVNGEDLVGRTVVVKTDSANLVVTPATAVTDVLGRVDVNMSASREGVYSIYVTVDGKTFVIGVNCGNTEAAYIETADEPEHLVALYDSADKLVSFKITDINGNAVTNLFAADGVTPVNDGTNAGVAVNNGLRAKYLHFIEKPAASTLVNSDLRLVTTDEAGVYALTAGGKTLTAEGKYTVRAILDNGAVATASWEVKAFETPVKLLIDVPANVELGTAFSAPLSYLDANDVEKDAFDAKLAATGYAIYSLTPAVGDAAAKVTVKTDEKYAGSKITLTAVSEMYDLVATEVVTVAGEAVEIVFEDDTLEVNVNNKVEWNVVDAEGNKVTLTNAKTKDIKYVVLDKPEDAKVSVYDLTGTTFDGEGKMALTSNKVGNVTVQVIAQVEVNAEGDRDNEGYGYGFNATLGATQTKYYTGTEIFAVGTADKGDVVVMSIGSNEIVINDAKAAIDAAPIVENNRTFVPFRALAEAFGATVAYDEATQAVTAELNGVTVVMTIGSSTYTINGEEAAMDVAPFINGSRTMVPVRFAAQAFGIKVIPTYDENGATADILFNL